MSATVSKKALVKLQEDFGKLKGLKLDWLSIPIEALSGFEPSQLAVIVNTLIDAALPQIAIVAPDINLGLSKSQSSIGERESYPDYVHKDGYRVELKGLFVDNATLKMKRPPTRREPSARIKENVTVDEVVAERDILLLTAMQLQEYGSHCCPVITDVAVFPMIECIHARDKRLASTGGKWIDGLPMVISKSGEKKQASGKSLTDSDYEKDTNFGKLKRIPFPPLQEFMKKHGAI